MPATPESPVEASQPLKTDIVTGPRAALIESPSAASTSSNKTGQELDMAPNEADTSVAEPKETAETAPLASSEDLKVKFIGGVSGDDGDNEVKVHMLDSSGKDPYKALSKQELMKYSTDPTWRTIRWTLFILFWIAWVAMLVVSVVIVVLAPKCPPPTPKQWWQKGPIYEVYVKSFKDSDGDGIGDIKGVELKLDYLYELGVGSVWLTPVYKSPMKDNGYDIADFMDIDPTFGTLDDLVSLLNSMHEKGIKLIMDFVPNHSSDQHEWFQKSVKRQDPYTDFYIWRDGSPGAPPNNWKSVFGGSAWTYNNERGQYFLHQFYKEMPDLNLRNPKVQEELKKVLEFWLDLGVDGFRVDSVAHFFEDESFENEIEVPDKDPDSYTSVEHHRTYDLPEVLDLLSYFRKILNKKTEEDPENPRIMMTEAYLPVDELVKYYGGVHDQIGNISQVPQNFDFISNIRTSDDVTVENILRTIKDYINMLPYDTDVLAKINEYNKHQSELPESDREPKSWPLSKAWPNFNIGNHDNSRLASRCGHSLVDAIHMIVMLLQGTPITYYGDEIGMSDTPTNTQGLRDHYRTPMQWDGNVKNAGFTNGTPWLPVNENYPTVNVDYQQSTSHGHMKVYKELAKLRLTEPILYGSTRFLTNGTFFGYARVRKGNPGYLVVANFGDETIVQDVTSLDYVPERGSIEVKGSPSDHAEHITSLKHIKLRPKEAMVMAFVPDVDKKTTVAEE